MDESREELGSPQPGSPQSAPPQRQLDEISPKGRFAIGVGWLLLLPIALLWLQYRQGVVNGSFANSPDKATFLFLPLLFLVGFSYLLHLIARRELPERSGPRLFFWIACAPLLAEGVVALLTVR